MSSRALSDSRAGMKLSFRDEPGAGDQAGVRRIVESSGFFSSAEIEVAVELVRERLERGPASGYHFLFADPDDEPGRPIGYTCYGPIAGTVASFDLYWIAVEEGSRRSGLGSALLAESEARIRRLGGSRVYVETSSRPQYVPTRAFYSRRGYRQEAVIEHFYAPGDAKVIYVKELS